MDESTSPVENRGGRCLAEHEPGLLCVQPKGHETSGTETLTERVARAVDDNADWNNPTWHRHAATAALAVVADDVDGIAGAIEQHVFERVPEAEGGRGEVRCIADGFVGVEGDVCGHIAAMVADYLRGA